MYFSLYNIKEDMCAALVQNNVVNTTLTVTYNCPIGLI